MKFTVEVGETEKIKIEFSRNWITGAMNTMGKWRDGFLFDHCPGKGVRAARKRKETRPRHPALSPVLSRI